MIYNGTFFYLHHDSESIVRYDLTARQVTKKKIPRNRVVRNSNQPLLSKLYLPQFDDNYLDLMTDENGVWGVFGLAVDNNTGKSFSEALILGSTNPQYDKRLFIDLSVQYMKTTSSEHVVYTNCFLFFVFF